MGIQLFRRLDRKMANITIPQLPSAIALSGSEQFEAVQSNTSVRVTTDQIAQYVFINYPTTGIQTITASTPITVNSYGNTVNLGISTGGITNSFLSPMPANTVKANLTGSTVSPQNVSPSDILDTFGATVGGILYRGSSTWSQLMPSTNGYVLATQGSGNPPHWVNLNLGTMAYQNANNVSITGGSLTNVDIETSTINQTSIGATTPSTGAFTNLSFTGTGSFGTISSGTWNGSPVGVSYGGTGASTANGARTNLGAAASGANSDITSLSGLTTPLSATQGGTGFNLYTTGDLLYASSSTNLARLNDVATGNVLLSGGVGVAPSWGKLDLTSSVVNALPVANGGTGATSLSGYLFGNGTSAVTAQATIPNSGLTNSSVIIGSTNISLGSTASTLAGLTSVTVTQDPTAALQLSTKQYVDGQVAAVSNTTFHAAVQASTTANLNATYSNGIGGVGATLTNAGTQAAFTTDGYTASLNDRILVQLQTSGFQNGIYTVTTVGSGSSNWVLTRATDFNTVGSGPNYIETGAATYSQNGNTYGAASFVMTTTGTIVVGTTNLVWTQTSSAASVTVSAPLTKTGSNIALGTVTVPYGGTGQTTLQQYSVLLGNGTGNVAYAAPNTTGYALLSTGASSNPAFGQLSLTAGVTGTLPVGNGGTGTATAFTAGSVVFAGASGVYTQDNAKFFWDNTNYRLGLNTATPQTTLTIVSNTQTTTPTATLPSGTDLYIVGANSANTRITQDAYGTGNYPVYTGRSARGTAASPTATQSGDFLAQFSGRGYGATGFASNSTAYFALSAAENFTDTSQGAYASVFTTATGSATATEAFRFGPVGQLGIGGATYGTSGYVLTSGGTSAAPTWSQVSLATGVTGTLPVANGGTGLSSYTTGSLLYASGTTTIAGLADTAIGNVLLSNGIGVAPVWGQVPLAGTSQAVTGVLPIANGGTNSNATPTQGGIAYGTGTAYAVTAAGTSGQVLTSQGTSAPVWSNVSSVAVTTLSFGTTGLTPSSATSGAITVSGTLNVANGGTGTTTSTGSGSNVLSNSPTLVTPALGTPSSVNLTNATNVPVNQATGTLSTSNGGTGNTATPTNGQLLIGNGSGFTLAQLSVGTGIGITNSSGSITLSNTGVLTLSFGTTGLTPNSASNGAIVVSGTLATGSGGTGLTSFTSGGALYATSTSALTTGTLPVTAGGTGSTTSTGSGSVVLANSPTISGTLSASVISASSTISDSLGNVRTVPVESKSTAYTLVAGDAGQCISITTGGVTVPSGVFTAGQTVTIYNNSSTSQTITQGSSVTMYQVGTTNTGNRTLASYGLITVFCVASNTFVITGGGLS